MKADTEERSARESAETGLPQPAAAPAQRYATARDLMGAARPGELDLFPLAMLMRANLGRTLLCFVLGALLAAGYSYTRQPRYGATATVLIPQQTGASATNMALQAATGRDLLGGGYDVYLDMLHSRTAQDKLIADFDLQTHYKVRSLEAAEGTLLKRSVIVANKEGLLQVTVQDEDPKMAASLANAYFAELNQLNAQLGITAAGQLRHYYEGEMVKEKDQLADAEVALEQSQQKTGVMEPQMQANAALGAEEQTRAQLRARQIDIEALLQSETPQNPDVIRLQSQIAGLEGQVHAFESAGGPGVGTPSEKMPAQALDYIRKQREVKFHEALLDMITRQVEGARQQESKDVSMIEVLDPARATSSPVWPAHRTWILIGAALGLVLGLFVTAVEGIFAVLMANPASRRRMEDLIRGRTIA